MRERPSPTEILTYAVLILASLPARLSTMRASLWLDEAWVANSLLSPSWKEMFYYPPWLQLSPSLFLTLARLLTKILGPSEPALRALPVVAGLIAIPVLAIALRKLFSPASALCGTSLIIVNFWAAKYAQHVKQYSSELLASALLCLLIIRYYDRPDRRNFTLLVGGLFVAVFLANTALFMGPSFIAAAALGPSWGVPSCLRAKRFKIAFVSFAFSSGLNYLVFIRPNRNSSLLAYWAENCLQPRHPLTSVQALFSSFAELLVPQVVPVAFVLGAAIVLAMLVGVVIALIGSARGSKKAGVILLLGPLPLAIAMVFSLLGLYPLLRTPRMLLWALPGCAVVLAATLDPLFNAFQQRLARASEATIFYTAAPACFILVLALNFIVFRYPRPHEQNSEAMRFLHQSMGTADCLYVHGRMVQQYDYYSRLQGWAAPRVYVGNSDWPCCPRNGASGLTSPDIQSYAADLRQAAAQIHRPGQLWILVPSGQTGHSDFLRWKIVATPGLMQLQSCYETHREGFDQSLVLAYECR